MRHAYVTKRVAPQGYVAVTKALAQFLYNEGYSITIAGNNVNSFHIFDGWYLGYTIDKKSTEDKTSLEYTFQNHVNSFMFYLERELGTYPVFYIRMIDIINYNQAQKDKVS